MKEFIFSVDDDCHILRQLHYLDKFRELDSNLTNSVEMSRKVPQGINTLIASITTSGVLGLIIAPLDLIVYQVKYQQMRGIKVSTKDIIKELSTKPGRFLMISSIFMSAFVRYLFTFTGMMTFINFQRREKLMEEMGM